MKLRLSILLLAAALAAAPAAGQTIKSLGYNTTNGQVVYSGTNTLRMPDQVKFGTNSAGIVSGSQYLYLLDGGGGVSLQLGTNLITVYDAIDFGGASGTALSNAATTRTNFGLGGTNTVTFSNIQLNSFPGGGSGGFVGRNNTQLALYGTNVSSSQPAFYGWDGFNNAAMSAGTARTNLGLGASNDVVFNSLELNGAGLLVDESGFFSLTVTTNFGGINFVNGTTPMFTLTGSLATFATNVTVNGNLSVSSLTTTTPSTWALDATQTAAATNGRLTLPSNANVIRLTNNNAISSVTNGVLGAFYYLVNQTTNAVTISNVGGITVQGGTPLTLGANQAATLVATGPTNASVAARGDLTDVALGGTANTAPSQTASSGSSLMTRSLYDERLPLAFGLVDQAQGDFGTVTLANGATGTKAAGGFDLITGSSNNATAVWNASSQANFGRKNTTLGSSANIAWSTRVMVGWWFNRLGSTNTEIRLQYGRAFNATTHAALSARGVGVRIVTNSVFFETHNGTSGFETTNAVAVTVNPQFYSAIVEAGVAKFYAGQTLVATVTNNVPTNNIADNEFGWVMSISNTSTNTTTMRVFANPGFVMQQ